MADSESTLTTYKQIDPTGLAVVASVAPADRAKAARGLVSCTR